MKTTPFFLLLPAAFILLWACERKSGEKLNTEEKIVNKTMEHISAKSTIDKSAQESIDQFFSSYEANFNNGMLGVTDDVKNSIRSSFASCFAESSPVGVICGQNNPEFVNRIEQGFKLYKSIGTKSMQIISKDIRAIDTLHYIVKVNWRYTAKKADNDVVIDFDTHYLLTRSDGSLKIFAYITGDEQKALKEHGLMN